MSKVLKKGSVDQSGEAPIIHLQRAFLEPIRSLLVLEPKERAPVLAARLCEESDPALVAKLGRVLSLDFLSRQIRLERAKEAKLEQFTLPGFEHIPQRIQAAKGKRLLIEKATYSDLRAYSKFLGARYIDRQREDPKLLELKKLMARMQKHARKTPGITVGEVFG